MTEANKDVSGALENNEQEMIDEGAPVQPSTDPALNGGDDDPAGTEGGDSSDEEGDSTDEETDHADEGEDLSDAEVADIAQAAVDTDSAEEAAAELADPSDEDTAGDVDSDVDTAVEEPIQETLSLIHI